MPDAQNTQIETLIQTRMTRRFNIEQSFFMWMSLCLVFILFLAFLSAGTPLTEGTFVGDVLNRMLVKVESIGSSNNSHDAIVKASLEESRHKSFQTLLTPIYSAPIKISTENGRISADIVEINVEVDGTMENPRDWRKAGWYVKGARPGQKGNVIINGHYDTNTGAPAAFWNLRSLKADDKLNLLDEYGIVHVYKVTETFFIGIEDPNRLDVFNQNEDKSELTLITCGGVWNPYLGTYDKRLVVKAALL